ncbi:MAG: DNA primase [SAR202 cluster bacterium]|nr:DNA primase [SAR202 cluster bacterium]|tara:strand:+ start:9263 stop:11071 length:1809 start_codon:yes stop_codon:yes gene_type:complete
MALVDEVKSRSDIVQIISDYVDLDTSSRLPKANCPFHVERSPSFVVYPESVGEPGSWRCFGSCAEGGDVISFVMKRENISFREALENLANRAGINISGPDSRLRKKPVTGLIEANGLAAEYFLSRLQAPVGEDTVSYLRDRGIDLEAAARRGLGLAPSGIETLSGHLRTRDVQARTAIDAGLITRKDDGSWRDMFTGRLTIEIRDERNRIIGFGGRSLDDSGPKYINTPQTDAFDKSSVLYGLNWAAESVRALNEAVVVEGYMDVIAAHEHGFTNVVASMGTAITSSQLDLLTRHVTAGGSGTIILCLDSDAAGEAATLRALEDISTALNSERRKGVEVKVARPNGGKDPDEAIRANPDSWRASISNADSLPDHLIDVKSKLYNLESDQGIVDFVQSVAPIILNISNPLSQARYLTNVSEITGVDHQTIKSIIDKPSSSSGTGNNLSYGESISPDQAAKKIAAAGGDPLEEHLLSLVLQRGDLREHAIEMPADFFHSSDNKALFTAWQSSTTLHEISSDLGDDLIEKAHLLEKRELPPSNQSRQIEDIKQCVARLRERHFRKEKKRQTERLKEMKSDEAKEFLEEKSLLPNENLRKVMTGRA